MSDQYSQVLGYMVREETDEFLPNKSDVKITEAQDKSESRKERVE